MLSDIKKQLSAFIGVLFSIILLLPGRAQAAEASLFLTPASGSFLVGSTFEVSIFVNTGGEAINAVAIGLTFPADKLQVVSPTTGNSFISIWTTPPSYSNTDGTMSFNGGLPNPGITSSAALVSTVVFRVKSPGAARVAFVEDVKVLANDGKGTNILGNKTNATYTLQVPPPAGPAVYSSSHPDQSVWYRSNAVSLAWDHEAGVTDFSYILDQIPTTIPDDKGKGAIASTSFSEAPDGINYFHIRAKSPAGWGGTTHFAVRVDVTAPARFVPSVFPNWRTTRTRPLLRFQTTDATSGIDHYEVRLVSQRDENITTLFTEEVSPYQLTELTPGMYTVVVRAYDLAGNYSDGEVYLEILKQLPFLEEALIIVPSRFPYPVAIYILLITLPILLTILLWWRRRRSLATRATENLQLLQEDVQTIKKKEEEVDNIRRQLSEELSVLRDHLDPSARDSQNDQEP